MLQYCIQNFSEIQRSNVVLSCSSDVIVISLRFTAMDNKLVDADKVLNEFYLLREKMKIINEVHTENMAFCRKCAKIIRARTNSIAEQIRKNFLN